MLDLQNAEIFRSVLESLPTGVCMVDQDRKVSFWNEGAERIRGYLRQDVLGRFCGEILLIRFPENRAGLGERSYLLDAAMRDGQACEEHAYLHHKTGYTVPVNMRAVPIRDAGSHVIGAAASFVERPWMSTLRGPESDLVVGHGLDGVTHLPDYPFTESYLVKRLKFASEHGIPFGLLCIQMDHLDTLAETHGRDAAEAALIVVAHTLRNGLDPLDFVGRWSDDQFLAIVAIWNEGDLLAAAERLKQLAQFSEIVWWGDRLPVSVSVGGTLLSPGEPIISLLGRTGSALEQAIGQGGNLAIVHRAPETRG
jgi:diguanylate cyclase (GGDEF)-like protein/PAS domain S-box-containing protein